ncbi:MAG TPA: Calx-beta domain-containing protein [Tepidisphaeraceae bacterium]|nr:Calx-beta domain-containing protein [Tepidisphaeraceae bacterium]
MDFHDSGAGPLPGPYGGNQVNFPIAVSAGVVLHAPNGDYLSLPTGTYVTVGFDDETAIDGPGNDIFVTEDTNAGEQASVQVSADGVNFTTIGTAFGGDTTGFDLSDIGFTQPVRAVRVIGLDNNGSSPGFDLTDVQVAAGSMGAGLGPLVQAPTAHRPVLIVPGLLGSLPTVKTLTDFLTTPGASPLTLSPDFVLRSYDPLLGSLTRLGYKQNVDLFVATYDWRLAIAPPDGVNDGVVHLNGKVTFNDQTWRYGVQYLDYWFRQAQAAWESANSGSLAGFSVDIIADNFGGLLTRAFLQSDRFHDQYAGQVHDVVTLGTPYQGSIDAFLAIAPNIGIDSLVRNVATEVEGDPLGLAGLKTFWDMAKSTGQVGSVLSLWSPSLLDLLPTYNVVSPSAFTPDLSNLTNPLLPDLNADPSAFTAAVTDKVTVRAATGLDTALAATYLTGNNVFISKTTDGDGGVITSTTAVPGAVNPTPYTGIAHVDLPAAPQVILDVLQTDLGLTLPAGFAPTTTPLFGALAHFIWGWTNRVDFSFVDSLGRHFSSIDDEFTSEIPGAFFSGNGSPEYFFIPLADAPGDGQLTLIASDPQNYRGGVIILSGNAIVHQTLSGNLTTNQSLPFELSSPVLPTITAADAGIAEPLAGNRVLAVAVTLSSAPAVDVTMQYTTADGTATAGLDYTAVSGTLTIPAGQTTGTILVPILGDLLVENDETFNVVLSLPTNAELNTAGGADRATVTIRNTVFTAQPLVNGRATYTDAAGTSVNVRLIGPGDVQLLFANGSVVPAALLATGTTARSAVAILPTRGTTTFGDPAVGGISIAGPLAGLIGPNVNLLGGLTSSGAIGRIILRDVTGSAAFAIGGGSQLIALGNVDNLDLTAAGPVQTIVATQWLADDHQPHLITAPSIGTLFVRGALADGISLSSTGNALGLARIGGSIDAGAWSIAGAAGTILARSSSPAWTANFGGALGVVSFTGNLAGTLSARAVRVLRTGGDLAAATLRFSSASTDVNTPAVGTLFIAGAINHSTILAAGSVRTVVAGSMTSSTLFSGIAQTVNSLPSTTDDFVARTHMSTFLIRPGGVFSDSAVAAAHILNVVLQNVQTQNNGNVFGFSTESIKTFSAASPRIHWNDRFSESLLQSLLNDLRVRILS